MPDASAPNAKSDTGRRQRLLEAVERRAGADGFVPWDRFMDAALYGEGVGFYSREDSPFGRTGDFYTAAHASPLFGRTIAEQIRSVARSLPGARPFCVLDVGAGDGALGEAVIAGLAPDRELVGRIDYVVVERSAARAARAMVRLGDVGGSAGIRVRVSGGIGADGPFSGVVLANELLDAQPARRLLWDGGAWKETGVRWDGDRFVPATAALDRTVPAPDLPTGIAPGTVFEFSPMAEGLVREVADHLVDGRFLVLDYGMGERELLAAHPDGTLAAVRRHRVVADPYEDPGSSDLSVFVNFDRVRRVAALCGFREVAFRRQAEALGEWGFSSVLDRAVEAAGSAEAEVRLRLGAKNLLFGFERFYALELAPVPRRDGPTNTAT